MQVHEQPQVVAEALHDDEHARVQGSATRQAVCALGEPPKRLHDSGGEPLAHATEQGLVMPEPDRGRAGKREHPLPPGDRGQAVLHQQGGGLGHAPAHTRGADAAALAGNGDPQAVAAALALRDEEAVFEVAAGDECLELITNERRQGTRALLEAVANRRPVFSHDGEGVAVLGAAWDVLRCSVTAGHRRCRCASRAALSAESFRGLGRSAANQRPTGGSTAGPSGSPGVVVSPMTRATTVGEPLPVAETSGRSAPRPAHRAR